MTDYLDNMTQSLERLASSDLGWVTLQPPIVQDDELSPPAEDHDLPYVMADYVLIDDSRYRFDYNNIRYARFNYLLERNGVYEAGELSVLQDLPAVRKDAFLLPNIETERLVRLCTADTQSPLVGNLGVEFEFFHDPTTTYSPGVSENIGGVPTPVTTQYGTKPMFGLGFKIVDDMPAVHPKFTMTFLTYFTPEDE